MFLIIRNSKKRTDQRINEFRQKTDTESFCLSLSLEVAPLLLSIELKFCFKTIYKFYIVLFRSFL